MNKTSNTLKRLTLLVACIFTTTFANAAANGVIEEHFNRKSGGIYFTTLSSTSVTQQYFERLLAVALENTVDDYGSFTLERFPVPMDQNRQIRTVRNGHADVLWTMTTSQRQRDLLAVEFPLLKGLLGKRVFLVSQQNQHAFKGFTTAQLKQRTAVQGQSWPDTQILRANGYKVSAVAWYDWQFGIAKLLTTNVVDYFPRSVMEATAELALRHNDGLVLEPYHLLSYPAYIYFFVNPNNTDLHDRLYAGLKKAEANGDFDHVFRSYPSHDEAMKLLQQSRTVHELQRFEVN